MLAGDTSWTRNDNPDWWRYDPSMDWWWWWWMYGGGGPGGGGGGGGDVGDPGGGGGGGGIKLPDPPLFAGPGERRQIPTDRPQWYSPDPNLPAERDQVYVPEGGPPVFRADVVEPGERREIPRFRVDVDVPPRDTPPYPGPPLTTGPEQPRDRIGIPRWTGPEPTPTPTPTVPPVPTPGQTTPTDLSQLFASAYEKGAPQFVGAPRVAEEFNQGAINSARGKMSQAVQSKNPNILQFLNDIVRTKVA